MSVRSQMFPPSPSFTETSLPPLQSRTYIITGATSGVGLELAKMLYAQSATVYLAARNGPKIASSITSIQSSLPASSSGRLEALELDLSDLESIPAAAAIFKQKESRLDGLVLNAGVMTPPEGSETKQGHELQMGTNCLGGHLLLRCLEEVLVGTAGVAGENAVRVVWLASTLQIGTPKGGMVWDEERDAPKVVKNQMENYMMSKVGNVFLAHDTAARLGSQGVLSVSVNPGFMKTELQRHMPGPASFLMGVVFKPPRFGAYSELFGLLSPDVAADKNGGFVIPWGRFGCLPEDVEACLSEGGVAGRFARWCERETGRYL